MAILKKDKEKCVTLTERDYMTLIEDHITLKALKIAGIEKMAIYQGIKSIMEDDRIEVHIKPVQKRYK